MLIEVASLLTKQAVCGACEEVQLGFTLWIQLGKQPKGKNWEYLVNIRGMISCNKVYWAVMPSEQGGLRSGVSAVVILNNRSL